MSLDLEQHFRWIILVQVAETSSFHVHMRYPRWQGNALSLCITFQLVKTVPPRASASYYMRLHHITIGIQNV